jgi:hypothetical protein
MTSYLCMGMGIVKAPSWFSYIKLRSEWKEQITFWKQNLPFVNYKLLNENVNFSQNCLQWCS